jgi:hypothetical protein
MRSAISQYLLSVSLLLSLLLPVCAAQEADQKKEKSEEPAQVCEVERSLSLAEEQVAVAKGLHKSPAEILLLTQAAHQLWPWQEKRARELFAEAYDLTDKYYREPYDDLGKRRKLWSQAENPHFAVIGAIARRDPEWARQLAERIRADADKFALPSTEDFDPAGKRLGAALALLPVNRPLAVSLAQSSFRYPASRALLSFLFVLAEKDQRRADQLFLEALRANEYRASVASLMNLAPYSFRLNRVVCEGDY